MPETNPEPGEIREESQEERISVLSLEIISLSGKYKEGDKSALIPLRDRLLDLNNILNPIPEKETGEFSSQMERSLNERAEELGSSLRFNFDPPLSNPELTSEQIETLKEFFGGSLEEMYLPIPSDLHNLDLEYAKVMYPEPDQARQEKDAQNHNGLISYRPSWFNENADIQGFDFQNETWGQAYLRSEKEELEELNQAYHPLIFVEDIEKPKYIDGAQKYGSLEGATDNLDSLKPILEEAFNQPHRFSLSHDQLTAELLPKAKEALEKKFRDKNIPIPKLEVILVPAALSNLQMTLSHPENSTTDTEEWNSTILKDKANQDSGRGLYSGYSGHGGAANVGLGDRSSQWRDGGFHLAVVFPKH